MEKKQTKDTKEKTRKEKQKEREDLHPDDYAADSPDKEWCVTHIE